ncbi:GNAT family N-acetyltransferase [Aquimarina aquimarini]|uniref:GNAT family N-acetyltransferase n=1 Tax=Aquimarina aquimarini TaxID=1191734 RepID=UPI000D55E227|nr:GNAT family N-acetyltransferase [Aquimarina aquimarini]
MSIIYTVATSDVELQQIIMLQQHNLPVSISQTEKEKEGFVTVQHDFTILKKMNYRQPHVIAKKENKLIGYALCMHRDFKNDIDALKPMFTVIDDQLPSNISYIIMGQICVDKAFRKQGVFRGLYTTIKNKLHKNYRLLITEVATSNIRSLQAHFAIGFKTLIQYECNGIKWHLIYWDWT